MATCPASPSQCKDIDQGCYALITDLKRLGMLEDTLVVWGGEFGRTNYCRVPRLAKTTDGIIIPCLYHLDGRRRGKPGSLRKIDEYG